MGAAACAAAIAAGCAIQSPPPAESLRRDALGAMTLRTQWQGAQDAGEAVQDDWLATFRDEQLDALVREALANNPDLRLAAARVEQASAQLQVARAAQLPALSVVGTGGVKVSDLSSALTGVMGLVSWELDLWGALRYQTAASAELLTAARSDAEFARQSLAASTAKAWFAACQTLLEVQSLEQMQASSDELGRLARQRHSVGAGGEQDVALADAATAAQRDRVAQGRQAHQAAVRALEMLLGRHPSAELAVRDRLPDVPMPVPAGVPLQVLERRPDLIAAERRIAAAYDRVGQGSVAHLPGVRLTGNLGYLDSDILQLKSGYSNPSGGAGAKLAWPIDLNGGISAQVAVLTAQQREALAQYARLALRAIGDVETALASERTLAEREEIVEKIVAERSRSLDLARQAFEVGRQDLRGVEQQRIALTEAKLWRSRLRAEHLSQRVNLHLALGGSFEPPARSAAP